MANPIFSIITPTYNRSHIIGKTIESVLGQKYKDFEHIIIDDGSTDNTEEVVLSFKDDRIRYFKKENEERGIARNHGISHARGEYICFLDSDDIYYSNHLLEAANYLEVHTDCIFLYQPFEVMTQKGKVIRKNNFSNLSVEEIAFNNVLCPIGAFIKKETLQQHPFDVDPKFTIAEDLYVWLIVSVRYGIEVNTTYTSCLINHEDRSMVGLDPDKLIYCYEKLTKLLSLDPVFSKYPTLIRNVLSSHQSLAALYYSIRGDKKNTLRYVYKSIKNSPMSIFRRRSLVIIKNLLFKHA